MEAVQARAVTNVRYSRNRRLQEAVRRYVNGPLSDADKNLASMIYVLDTIDEEREEDRRCRRVEK